MFCCLAYPLCHEKGTAIIGGKLGLKNNYAILLLDHVYKYVIYIICSLLVICIMLHTHILHNMELNKTPDFFLKRCVAK